MWRGRKFEDRYTLVAILFWDNVESSHAFFTSAAYEEFHKLIQPALNGRKVSWASHALLDHSALSSQSHLSAILDSPAIEVALTKVVEGGVSGYYHHFNRVVTGVLDNEPGCDGFFISPIIENPEDQLLLINWKSVDVRSCTCHYSYFQYLGSSTNSCSGPSRGFREAPGFQGVHRRTQRLLQGVRGAVAHCWYKAG